MIVEPKFQTSFIPKAPITPGGVSLERVSVNLFAIIALVIFLGSILLAGGAYAYKYTLNQELTKAQATLVELKSKFDPGFVTDITRLNSRMVSVKALIDKHIAPSFIFSDLVEQYTLEGRVAFSNFNWSYGDTKSTITMSGVAKDYASVALQSKEFANHIQYLKDQSFTGIAPDSNGNINFTFSATVDKSVFDFKNKRTSSGATTQ